MNSDHSFQTVVCRHCGHIIQVPVYCGNRFCQVCSQHRNKLIRYKLKTFMDTRCLAKGDSFKFLTLTIKNQSTLPGMMDHLTKSFRKLRQRALWRNTVRGGAAVLEVTGTPGNWHVHFHIVLESAFLPFKALLAEWKSVSGGSGVYIKQIHGSQVIGYITKYLTKCSVPLQEQFFMSADLKGRRLFQPFGGWFKPIAAIKPMNYWCPDCDSHDWFFGTGTRLFEKSEYDWQAHLQKPRVEPETSNQSTFEFPG